MEQVVLVDLNDQMIGLEEKMAAHEKALLHRAFSVFLYRTVEESEACRNCDEAAPDSRSGMKFQLLLHKRAAHKYHCGGLWTNTCCSHPRNGETVADAASRRLMEELDITIPAEELKEIYSFVYRYPFMNGLTEFEFDHVILGQYDGTWTMNPEEVEEIAWMDVHWLQEDIRLHADKYTPWFITALGSVVGELKRKESETVHETDRV